MRTRQRRCFLFGASLLLLTAAAHLAGHFSPPRPPADESEAQLMRLMTSYTRELGHGPRSMHDLLSGFSLSFSILLALAGALDWLVARRRASDAALLRDLALLNALGTALLTGVSVVYFFPPPTICLGLAFLGFACALVGRAADDA